VAVEEQKYPSVSGRGRGRGGCGGGGGVKLKDIAAGTLVFGFAGPFQPVGVELGILHREQRWILGRGASIGSHNGACHGRKYKKTR